MITYADITLDDGTWLLSRSGLRCDSEQLVQPSQRPRAQFAQAFGRQNQVTLVSFAVERTFDTIGEAERFCHLHFKDLPKSGDLIHRTGGHDEDTVDVVYTDAVKVRAMCSHKGKSVHISYTFRCGLVFEDVSEMGRVTEDGEERVTEDGEERVVES